MRTARLAVGLARVAAGLAGCASTASGGAAETEVADALQRYQAAARTTNPDAIAANYTEDAVLLEPGIQPIESRAAIRAFIASFPGVQVHTATATPETIDVHGDAAYLWGSFFERLSFPGQPLSEQHGKFVIEWRRQPSGQWLIHHFYRIPVTTVEQPGG